MSNEVNNGGPAFACAACNGHQEGMSLRDWFSGMALQGLLASGECSNTLKCKTVEDAYHYADAMLKQKGVK